MTSADRPTPAVLRHLAEKADDAVHQQALHAAAEEIEQLRALVVHMDRCVQRGGPRNYVEFLEEPLTSAHAAVFDTTDQP